MGNENFESLIEHKIKNYRSDEFDFKLLSKYKSLIEDSSYFAFVMKSNNCGFYFDQSLQIYEYSKTNDFNNIDRINH